jgi:hypothetical protein
LEATTLRLTKERRIRPFRRKPMTTALVMLGGIALIGGIIVLLDWLARRKDHRSEHRHTA